MIWNCKALLVGGTASGLPGLENRTPSTASIVNMFQAVQAADEFLCCSNFLICELPFS